MIEMASSLALVENAQIAEILHEVADLLESQDALPPRVGAYRIAAHTVNQMPKPAREIYTAEGPEGLQRLPGIGHSLAHSIGQIIDHGHLQLLDRLRGDFAAERSFCTVPDIGVNLAHRIHEELHIETLEELQQAAEDGTLAQVAGMGPKRVRAVVETLAARLGDAGKRARRETGAAEAAERISVSELLSLDQEYRKMAKANQLPLIAPRKFNPTGAAWLPILHTTRASRHYTVLFSNSAHAHEAGTTHDWVVIYRDDSKHGRWTVITAHFGKLQGKRMVVGRERECLVHYQLNERE